MMNHPFAVFVRTNSVSFCVVIIVDIVACSFVANALQKLSYRNHSATNRRGSVTLVFPSCMPPSSSLFVKFCVLFLFPHEMYCHCRELRFSFSPFILFSNRLLTSPHQIPLTIRIQFHHGKFCCEAQF